ncbi:MAG: hypothetical protein JW852_12190, partial [Spirochaetales bacterium]|nr:hypothetical protein [Spirochaetales bacterium]
GGSILALRVLSALDAAGNDVSLSAGGSVLVGEIAVGKSNGSVTIDCAGDLREADYPAPNPDDEVDITARRGYFMVGSEFGSAASPALDLELDLAELTFVGNDLFFDFTGDIVLTVIASGVVDVTASGSMTALSIVSGAGDIALESYGGSIYVGCVDAGVEAGTVTMRAFDSILEIADAEETVDIVSNGAYLFAGSEVGGSSAGDPLLETQIAYLEVEVGNSVIGVSELDDLELGSVIAPEGTVSILAGGRILISGEVTTGAEGGSIYLNAGGELYLSGTHPVTTDTLEAVAVDGIYLRTEAETMSAYVTGAGILEIREADDLVLSEVTNADGPVRIIAGGTITAGRVVSLCDEPGNNVGLIALAGDVLVGFIGAGSEYGQISISSAGYIGTTPVTGCDVGLRGALGILYAQGRVSGSIMTSFARRHGRGKQEALYVFERGRRLDVNDLAGNVELFFSLENSVHVTARGDVSVIYLDTHGHDVSLRSQCGDIVIERLDAADGWADVDLRADGSLSLIGRTYSGEIGWLAAGGDIELSASRGDIVLHGAVTAGTAVQTTGAGRNHRCASAGGIEISSGSRAEIYGPIESADDVTIRADDGMVVDAAITATDRIEIRACGDSVIADGSVLIAERDIDIWFHGDLSIGGSLSAGDDICIWVYGDFVSNAILDAEDDITAWIRWDAFIGGDWNAADDIIVWSGGTLQIPGTLYAGDDLRVWGRC